MLDMPRLPIVVYDPEWPSFAKARTAAKYERVAVPGAFANRERGLVYCPEDTFIEAVLQETEWARFLLQHEFGHITAGHTHPTSAWGMLKHAFSVGFDTRAGTRLLRWRWHDGTFMQYLEWEREMRIAWGHGSLRPMSVTEVLRLEAGMGIKSK